jgi:hypothetical protein
LTGRVIFSLGFSSRRLRSASIQCLSRNPTNSEDPMNGRCTTDPLDFADDICELCGNEFCSSCLIRPHRGKGAPVCKSCALANSGVRGARTSGPRPSRSELRRAREALAEYNAHRPDPHFRYFDELSDHQPAPTDSESSDAVSGSQERPRKRGLRRRRDDVGQSVDETPSSDEAPSADGWDPPPPDSAPDTTAKPSMERAIEDEPAPGQDPGSRAESLADRLHAATQGEVAPPTKATDQLDHLRRTGDVPASARRSDAAVDHGHEPAFAALTFDDAAASSPANHPAPLRFPVQSAPAESLTPNGSFDWSGADGSAEPMPTPSMHVDPFALGDPFAMPDQSAPTSAHPTPPVTAPAPAAPPNASGPMPAAERDAARPATAGNPTSADRDALGNWIPPVLRGMAPAAERERAEPLPKRR